MPIISVSECYACLLTFSAYSCGALLYGDWNYWYAKQVVAISYSFCETKTERNAVEIIKLTVCPG